MVKERMWFDGIFASDGTEYFTNDHGAPAGEIELTAKYTANDYTVTFDANGGACDTTTYKTVGDSVLIARGLRAEKCL